MIMKKFTLIAVTLIAACLFAAGSALAQTPVAGFSPSLASPQPATAATLERDANRLIRWQGWLNVDAFSGSVLAQMQRQVNGGAIVVGQYTIDEPAVAQAVANAMNCNPRFEMNPNLELDGAGETLTGVKLYVWTYRHNHADRGLYQLYVSAKGKMNIGTEWVRLPPEQVLHKDIQSLNYEFGGNLAIEGPLVERPVIVDIEIWRGAVVTLQPSGAIDIVGNLAEVRTIDGRAVLAAPMSDWERAPSLIRNPNYNPGTATGTAYVRPLDRAIQIQGNAVQTRPGNVQVRDGGRVMTIPRIRLPGF